jgi:hypothetical protein
LKSIYPFSEEPFHRGCFYCNERIDILGKAQNGKSPGIFRGYEKRLFKLGTVVMVCRPLRVSKRQQ